METKKYGRTHEECNGCLFKDTEKQLCDGHIDGPFHCQTFTKDDTEERIQIYYELGQILGLEEAARFLIEKAKNDFVLDKNENAFLLKKISQELEFHAKIRREDFDKKNKS